MTFDLLTIFPKIFDSYFQESILRRAQKEKQIQINVHNIRDYTQDKHKTTDDLPYGGGPGMVMTLPPIYRTLKSILPKRVGFKGLKPEQKNKSRVILLSTRGKTFNQKKAEELLRFERLILVCGRYEGVDQRLADHFVDEEISMGRFVLTGGELPAMVIVDAITRLIPGVLGNIESLREESFSKTSPKLKSQIEYPQYTRPRDFHGLKVPRVLLSGDHQTIQEWRQKNRK